MPATALPRLLQRFQRFCDLVRVPDGADLLEDSRNAAVFADYVSRAIDAHVLLAEHGLLLPHAVCLADLMIGVGEQREREVVLLLEAGVLLHRVTAHAEDHRIQFPEPGKSVSKRAR